MKHKGNTPAIYATSRRVYFIRPLETIPRNARFIIGHFEEDALFKALRHTTHERENGTREPEVYNHKRSYFTNVETALQKLLCSHVEPVTIEEFRILRHTLGSSHLDANNPNLGWRNYFNTGKDSTDYPIIAALVERGLMVAGPTPCYYHVTERGGILAGMDPGHASVLPKGQKTEGAVQ